MIKKLTTFFETLFSPHEMCFQRANEMAINRV